MCGFFAKKSGTALLAAALCWTLAGPGAAQTRRVKPSQPLRAGMVLAHPRLCAGEEPGQKELRLLRTAFGLTGALTRAAGLPGFYLLPDSGGAAFPRRLVLDTAALWGEGAPRATVGAAVKGGGEGEPHRLAGRDPVAEWGPLAAWGRLVKKTLPMLEELQPPLPGTFQFSGVSAPLFWASRLWGSAMLPFLGRPGEAGGPCRGWPRGVTWRPQQDGTGRLTVAPPAGGSQKRGMAISLFATEKEMWREFAQGRLDALWLEHQEFRAAAAALSGGQLLAAAAGGSLRIILRLGPSLQARLGATGVLALSRAVNRPLLALTAGVGFVPPVGFLAPFHLPADPGQEGALAWDSRRARQVWLAEPLFPRRLTLAVLEHPLLARLGGALASQWKKTLNLDVGVAQLAVDQFLSAGAGFDALLDVVDLDDGSLQALWETGLGNPSPPPARQFSPDDLARWEAALARKPSFLPLLGNRHFFLARQPGAAGVLAFLCPGCPTQRPSGMLNPGRP